MPIPLILPLDSPDCSLDLAGGKGASLARLRRAGYPVPPGFVVTTDAYRDHVQAHGLESRLRARLAATTLDDPQALEAAAGEIRVWFAQTPLAETLAARLADAYADLGAGPVAVRSSATAEDLPDLSFAGQQDTFLNVLGAEVLLRRVVDCWSSLWTARAIGYRARNAIPMDGLGLAVVVQVMVESEASGVLFTANPLTDQRDQMVVDATLGLGEALVSGQVEPDHYVVDLAHGRIADFKLGAKALAIRGRPEGGVAQQAESAATRPALPEARVLELARLGQRVAADFGGPQDIEWAWAADRLHLLQARPITSLFPLPDDLPAEPLRVLFSFGAVQGMLDPITPLGRDTLRLVISGGGRLFHYRVSYERQTVLRSAGDRLWADITPVIRHGVGRRVAQVALEFVEPSVKRLVELLWDDPRLSITAHAPSPSLAAHVLSFLGPMALRVMRFMANPERGRARADRHMRTLVADTARRSQTKLGRDQDLAQRLSLLREMCMAFPHIFPSVAVGLIGGMAAYNLLLQIARRLPRGGPDGDPARRVLELTRGLPHNVTTEMDLALWETASRIQADPAAQAALQATPAAELAAAYQAGQLPVAAQAAAGDFLGRYGFRGVGEIDLGRPRWDENPTPVFQALQSYLRITDPEQAPDRVFARGALAAGQSLEALAAIARRTRGGWLKAHLIRILAGRLRQSLGMRESPKFYIVQLMHSIRRGLLESGAAYAAGGLLRQADDIFFLRLDELEALARGEMRDWPATVAVRRQALAREMLRRQVPRLLLSDGRAFYEGLTAAADEPADLVGSPVSPGVAEGRVRVVLDPHGAQLQPGEILVCPGTDPAWTPLFLAAGGLVMEVGGMMTHGAVVAREYGLPAVVGVDRATQRLRTGERIRLDGSSGQITRLGETNGEGRKTTASQDG